MATVKDIKPNSHTYHKSEEEKQKNAKPVLRDGASMKEKSLWGKIKDAFIAEEIRDVKSYVVFDIVIPAIKRTFRDLTMNVLDMSLFGKTSKSSYDTDTRGGRTYVSYDAYSGRRERDDYPFDKSKSRNEQTINVRDLDRVMFRSKDDAIEVLSWLMDNIAEYGVASVADFLGAANLDTNPIHNKWGWYDVQGSSVMEDPDGRGYYIRLPRPKPI